jgi:hypothetical protein
MNAEGESMTNFKDEIQKFTNQCVDMRAIYVHARTLFETSDNDQKSLMFDTAPIFFRDLNIMFIEHIILQVCKITDPAKDNSKNENFTLEYFLTSLDFSSDTQTKDKLTNLYQGILEFRDKIKIARNKLISHSDRVAVLSGNSLGAAPTKDWDEFWLKLQDFIAILHQKVFGSPMYINGVGYLSDADNFLRAMKQSKYFDRMVHGSDAAVQKKCFELAFEGTPHAIPPTNPSVLSS